MSKMSTCPACRFTIPHGAAKCGHCQTDLIWPPEPPDKSGDILGYIILFVIIAWIVDYFFPNFLKSMADSSTKCNTG